MPRTLEDVRQQAMQLSIEERSWLAEDLLNSLRSAEERQIADEWVEVAEQRLDEIEAGTAELVPVDDAIRRARTAVADARKASRRR